MDEKAMDEKAMDEKAADERIEDGKTGDERISSFEFRGNAREWFGIWIVNLLLSIVTLGIYSAWAKVRRNKYFYNNTSIEGRSFDYHATGKQILIGRLIVVTLFISYSLLANYSLEISGIVVLVLMLIYPWVKLKALQFNARMSSFSNVRFHFAGGLLRAFWVFMLLPLLTILTLGLTYPMLERARYNYIINRHQLGTSTLSLGATLSAFYGVFFKTLPWFFIAIALGWMLGWAAFLLGLDLLGLGSLSPHLTAALTSVATAILVFWFIYRTLMRNMVYNHTTLEGHTLRSNIRPLPIAWITITNLLLGIASLGLLLPWGHIRMAKYLADNTGAKIVGTLDEFVGTEKDAPSALGDAYSDLEGIDLGIPI